MNINLSLSPAPGIISNWLVMAIYKASAPSTLVGSQSFAAPHTAPQNVTFTGVDDDTYIVLTYENTVNAVGGTIRHRFIYEPGYTSAQIRLKLVLICDGNTGNPTPGTSTFIRPDLAGWIYDAERRATVGTMIEGMDFAVSNNNTQWDLLQSGDQFQQNEIFIVHFQPILVLTPQNPVTASFIKGSTILTGDTVLDATALGWLYILQGAGTTLKVTLPDFGLWPDNLPIMFLSEGGNHLNATLETKNTGEVIKFIGLDRRRIYLGQGSESVCLIKKTIGTSPSTVSKLYVLYPSGDFGKVGEIVHQAKINPVNTVLADGSELSRATYPRLWEYVQTLDASDLVSDTVWGTQDVNTAKYLNKGKYSTGDGSNTFRVPLLYDPGYLRAADGATNKAGAYAFPMLMDHVHESQTGKLPDAEDGHGVNARRIGQYSGEFTDNPDATSSPKKKLDNSAFGTNQALGPVLGDSNAPASTYVYMLIRI